MNLSPLHLALLVVSIFLVFTTSIELTLAAKLFNDISSSTNTRFHKKSSSVSSTRSPSPRSPTTLTQTPPMGWNSWNLYGCGVSADLLKNMSDAIVDSGLAAKGYVFVNSDDCWMLNYRNSTTHTQIPDPTKFPLGWKPVTDYIHSRCTLPENKEKCGDNQMFAGLYTAKGFWTCQRRAASCYNEALDAKYYASVGIDYVKDDSCSPCIGSDDNEDYHRMWMGIQASRRPMFLSVEANPTDTLITKGGYANSKRVGHDIKPYFHNMITLVDIGSNLYPFAHNGSAAFSQTKQGFWNDLDMLEIGNGPDFKCGESDEAAALCRMHFSYWTIMKALLLMGNDVTTMDKTTLSILGNDLAISVNQDPLGIQARRVSVQMPSNNSLAARNYTRNFGVLEICNSSRSTQKWKFNNKTTKSPTVGFLQTVTSEGEVLCLANLEPSPGISLYRVAPCPTTQQQQSSPFLFEIVSRQNPWGTAKSNCRSSQQNCTIGSITWENQLYASGPWPHTRYLTHNDDSPATFFIDVENVLSETGNGGTIQATDTTTIQNDNLVGGVTRGGKFCLDAVTMGMKEVWTGKLDAGGLAVLLSNRSPADDDTIMFDSAMIGAQAGVMYKMTNVWTGEETEFAGGGGSVANVPVKAWDVAYFVLTPM